MDRNVLVWRISLAISDDPFSRARFHEALAGQPASVVRLMSRSDDKAKITGEVMVEVAPGEGLGTLLGALRNISPQVFVTCADPPGNRPGGSPQ